jgi:tryptophan 2,3-dioxygenase
MSQEHRVQYNKNYTSVFGEDAEAMAMLRASEEEPTLGELVQRWLERTPGLEADGFNFWGKYQNAVKQLLNQQRIKGEVRDKIYSDIMLYRKSG